MVVENINVSEAVEKVKRLLKEEKNLSPSFAAAIEILVLLVSILVNRLGLNSRNSSIPSSKEPLHHRRSKRPGRRRKKPGGQKGHDGCTLEKIDSPDEIEDILIDRTTLPRGHYEKAGFEARQVFDMKVSLFVKEYRAEILKDQNGKEFIAEFPASVICAAQYGPHVKATSVYLSQFQLIPLARVEDYFRHQIGLSISKGSISNFNKEAYQRLDAFESWIKKELLCSKVNHSDETGINIDGQGFWIHTLSNDKLTFYHPDPQRGKAATDRMGLLPHYEGTLCHDHWKPYYRYDSLIHALCNSHHLRELERAHEQENQNWAKKMQGLLIKINKKVEQSGGRLKKSQITRYQKRYRDILEKGEKECPKATQRTGQRGRIKQSFARNLLERLRDFEDDTLRFMTQEEIPFTNNQAERDLRMTKVQQKISGCFRSLEGAQIFCRIRAFLSTCQKQGVNPSDALRELFQGKLPHFVTSVEKC